MSPGGDRVDVSAAGDSVFRSLVMSAPVAMHVLDAAGMVQLWNPAAEEMFGWERESVIGKRDPSVCADDEIDLLLRNVAASADPIRKDVVRCNRSGRILEISLSASHFVDEASGRSGVLLIADDITERKNAERATLALTRAAEHRTRFLAEGSALLDDSLDYHATLNNLARLAVPYLADYCLIDEVEDETVSRVALVHADPAMESLLERDAREPLTGDPDKHPVVRAMLTGESVLVEEVTDAVLLDISHDEAHLSRLRKIGIHSFLVVPLENNGKILGAITFVYSHSRRRYTAADMDVAEELARRAARAVEAARLYRQSQMAVQARERLLAIVSHDLRNALATVLLNASAILDSRHPLTLERPIADQLQWIARSAEQMNRLISDLLDLSAIELGRLTLEASRQPVSRLINDAGQMFRPLASEEGVRFEATVSEGVPDVLVDPGRLQQVLANLLSNALRVSSRGSLVQLVAERSEDGKVVFSVTDNGPGIEPEQLQTIFDRSWHGRRGRRGGAGLGLGISKAIVEGLGGRIWVESTIGSGSRFAFTIPLAG